MKKIYQLISDVCAYGYKSTRSARIHNYKNISSYMFWYKAWKKYKNAMIDCAQDVLNCAHEIEDAEQKISTLDSGDLDNALRRLLKYHISFQSNMRDVYQSQVLANTRCMMDVAKYLEKYY